MLATSPQIKLTRADFNTEHMEPPGSVTPNGGEIVSAPSLVPAPCVASPLVCSNSVSSEIPAKAAEPKKTEEKIERQDTASLPPCSPESEESDIDER